MKKIFSIVSGSKSGALNIALEISTDLKKRGFNVKDIFRKYNKTDITDAVVLSDQCTIDYIFQLSQLIKKERPDLIIVHGYSTHIWTKIAVAISKVSVKLIHVEHNREKYSMVRSFLTKKLDKYTDKYICVSNGVAKHLEDQGVDSKKIIVIYNGIVIENFACNKEEQAKFTIGMVGRFSKQKDQLTLIKAIEIIKKSNKNVKLILVGDGKTKEACIKYVNDGNLEEEVKFKSGQFKDVINCLDLFVLSTNYEGFGLVICEAMAANIPVIASNVIGVNEIIVDNENGFLVEKNNEIILADKIVFCLENRDCLAKIVEKANEYVKEKYPDKLMKEKYYDLVKSLIEEGK